MTIELASFIFGAILLSTGCIGGGLSIKDISIPKIGIFPRVFSTGLGTFFILMGVGLSVPTFPDTDTESSLIVSEPKPVSPEPSPIEPDSVSSAPPPANPLSYSDPDKEFKSQVGSQLLAASSEVGLAGYELTHDPFLGQLADNSKEEITLTLSGGVSYGIIGVCDADCRDMDIRLFDENGNEVAVDSSEDDIPIVSVEPQWDGPFVISVEMHSCSAPYCYYGLGALGIGI